MNQITDPPLNYSFGLSFNYALWSKDTVLTLTNVPWNNDYRDIISQEKLATLNAYIDSNTTTNARIQGVSQASIDRPVKINIPINRASRFNYLRASNPIQPGIDDTQQDYYYFITGVRYIAGNTTELTVQLDLWATYGKNIQFGNCYIERGHIGIANSKAFDNYGRDYLTKPEGLDIGGEYVTKLVRSKKLMSMAFGSHDILVASVVDLEAEAGDLPTAEQPDLRPKLVNAKGGIFAGLPSGASYYIFRTADTLALFLKEMENKPWVTQGILSITIIPDIKRYLPTYELTERFGKAPSSALPTLTHDITSDWRNNHLNTLVMGRYQHLKKMLVYPYMVIEMTTWTATPIVLKPESWNSPNATIIERACMVPPNQRVIFAPQSYNSASFASIENPPNVTIGQADPGDGDDGGEYLDLFTVIGNFPTMAILNNSAAGYMASNANSIAYQNQSADWSQQRALQGASTAYDQSSAGIDLTNTMANIGIGSDTAQTQLTNQSNMSHMGLNAASSVGTGLANGGVGVVGGAASAVTGMASTALNIANANAALALRSGSAVSSAGAQTGNAGFIRDTNNTLAQFSARGDYQNTIAGINSKIQDSRMTQPTTSGQVGGEAMNIANNTSEVSLRFKTLDNASATSIGEYWLRYGYAVQQFAKLDNLMVMSKFTYWKLSETYIKTAPMPETYKQAIRGIFEKGVTVWADADDIGVIDMANNAPLSGVTL